MKRHPLALVASTLSAVLFISRLAAASQLELVRSVRPVLPVLPLSLPNRPIPLPTAIPGPLVQLPGPTMPIVSIPGVVLVKPFLQTLPAQPVQKGFFASSQKAFASAPGKGIDQKKLDAAFDSGSKPSAPAVETGDKAVDVKDAKAQKKETPKRRPVKRSVVIPVPTQALEDEIGIAGYR